MYDDFLSFVRAVVQPGLVANPTHVRLDGERTGGSREVAGKFQHRSRVWTVHADTHYEPLLIAARDAEAGNDPFVEEDTPRGLALVLTATLQAAYPSPHKHLYIYSW